MLCLAEIPVFFDKMFLGYQAARGSPRRNQATTVG
jgi:hypothetical protein